jgi:hypothetical protein
MDLFTLEQAEAMLPKVGDDLRTALVHVVETSTGNGHVKDEDGLAQKRRRAEELVDDLNQRLTRINGWGIELKGIDEGLIDFPSEREGRTVYLCWRLGEEHIGWWHELDAGFAGRQPL